MKKLMFSFVLLFAAMCSVETNAQKTPNEFNFQGVCAEKGKEVNVVFCILNSNNDSVYVESQKVMTNQNGAFSTRIGKGERVKGYWSSLDWAYSKYKIQVSVNDEVIALSDFASVPYAKVAEKVGSLGEEDIYRVLEESRYMMEIIYEELMNRFMEMSDILKEQINSEFEAQNAEIATIRDACMQLQGNIDVKFSEHEVMIQDIMSVTKELQSHVSELNSRMSQQEEKLSFQDQKLASMESILNEQKDMVNYLENNLEYLVSTINSLNVMIEEQTNIVKGMEMTVETQKAKIEEQENKINNLEAVIEAQNQIIAKQDIVNNEQNTVILELQKRLEENEPLMIKLKALLEELER